jgi:uncharacterized protein
VVKVKVLDVDAARKRIALTMRLADEVAPKSDNRGTPPPRRNNPPQRPQPQPAGAMAAAFAKLRR